MKQFLTLSLLSPLLLSACVMAMNPQKLNISVASIQTADPIKDANAALKAKNNTLIGYDQRGLKVPGVKAEDLERILQHCPVQRLGGMGDVVRSETHLKQMQTVYQYSLQYNQIILNASACE